MKIQPCCKEENKSECVRCRVGLLPDVCRGHLFRRGSTGAVGRSFSSSDRMRPRRCSIGTSTGGPLGTFFSSNRYVHCFPLLDVNTGMQHEPDVAVDFQPKLRALSMLSQCQCILSPGPPRGEEPNQKPKQTKFPEQQSRTCLLSGLHFSGRLGERGGDGYSRVFPLVYPLRVGKPPENETSVPARRDHLSDRCAPRHTGKKSAPT